MEQITVKRMDGSIVQLISKEPFRAVTRAEMSSTLMGDDSVSLTVVSSDMLAFGKGDHIEIDGAVYTLRTIPERVVEGANKHVCNITFHGALYDLMKTQYRNTDALGASTKSIFDLTYSIRDFVRVLINNVNRDYPGMWAFDEDNCPDTEPRTISFSRQNCLQVLQSLCSENEFGLEFRITQENGVRTIHIGKFGSKVNPPGGSEYFEWGRGNGLYQLKEKKVDDKAVITRLWVEGGSTNIKSGYRDYSERLQLPYPRRVNKHEHTLADGTVISAGSEYIGIDDDSKRYLEDTELRDALGSDEDAVAYDEIYPKRTGKVTALGADINSFADDTMDFDLCEKDDNGTKYLINGVSAKITFISGKLAGQQFELSDKGGYDHATKTFKLIPFTDGRGLTIPTSDTDAFRVGVGDRYKLTDINMPDSYVDDAEEELWYAGMSEFRQRSQARAQYELVLDRLYLVAALPTDSDVCLFRPGDYIPVRDDRFGIAKYIRIQKVVRDLMDMHDYTLTLSDITTVPIISQTIMDVIEQGKIIENNHLKDVYRMRRGWRTTEELRSMVYDTDGYFDPENIRPNSIDTNMLTVGSKSQQFVLSEVLLQANVDGNPNQFRASDGVLSHLTIDDTAIRHWNLAQAEYKLTDTKGYYLFAKCSKTGNTGVWYMTQEQLKVEPTEDPNNYYFQVGIIGSLYSDDNFRDFTTTYGFTRINGNTITTGIIKSTDGQSYIDIDNNRFRVGDQGSEFSWNKNGDRTLRVKGTIVQSPSGDESEIGCYRGAYVDGVQYYSGDEVTYDAGKGICLYRCISNCIGIAPDNTDYWDMIAQCGESGKDGISPNTAYKSTVFLRSNTIPSTPTGGSYDNPVPDGWSDGIPYGEAILWASTRIFTNDEKPPQQDSWTMPRQMTDTADFDVEYSSILNPSAPSGHPNTNNQWSNTASESTIWMATSTKSNGVWSAWQISRIKGEKGEDGTSIRIKGSLSSVSDLPAVPSDSSDCYIIDGYLYVWDGDSWTNAGQFKGDKGDTGQDGTDGKDGQNAYVHIKYAKSLTTNDWSDNNGETPDKYIGIYSDLNPTDSLVWSDYTWSKWMGDDGFGYEYIYKRTSTSDAPRTPTSTSQDDDYVPSGWTDDPTGINDEYKYEWVCYRKKVDGKWGAFIGSASDNSVAALWAKFGSDGKDGVGVTIDKQEILYCQSASYIQPAESSFTTSKPTLVAGYYMWVLTRITYSDGTVTKAYSVTRNGSDGKDGQDGTDGKDGQGVTISSTSVTYCTTSTSSQPSDSSFTSSTVPSVSIGSYLWSKTVVTYSDGTQVKSYTVSRVGSDGTNGTPGTNGTDGKTTYLHIAYANNSTGSSGFSTTYFDGALYIGTYTDYSPTDSSLYTKYTWARLRGQDGTDGTDGVDGSNAKYKVVEADVTSISYIDGAYSPSSFIVSEYTIDGSDKTATNVHYIHIYGVKNGTKTYLRYSASVNKYSFSASSYNSNAYDCFIFELRQSSSSDSTLISSCSVGVSFKGADGQDGKDGEGRSPVYRGEYSSSASYYGTSTRGDIVKYNSQYWIARPTAGSGFSSKTPSTSSAFWESFGTSFESVATSLLLAENANIAGFVFKSNKMYSQDSGSSIVLDGVNGTITAKSGTIGGFNVGETTLGAKGSYMTYFSQGEIQIGLERPLDSSYSYGRFYYSSSSGCCYIDGKNKSSTALSIRGITEGLRVAVSERSSTGNMTLLDNTESGFKIIKVRYNNVNVLLPYPGKCPGAVFFVVSLGNFSYNVYVSPDTAAINGTVFPSNGISLLRESRGGGVKSVVSVSSGIPIICVCDGTYWYVNWCE